MMARVRNLAAAVVLLGGLSFAAVAVSPTAATSGLSWSPPPLGCGSLGANSLCYTPTALTASGGVGISSGNPYQWSIIDAQGTTLATITTSAGKAATAFGTLDCTGSSDNSHCGFSAPGEFPSGGSVIARVSDGATQADFTMTFDFGSLPAAYMEARARMLGMNNAPMTYWSDGGTPPTFQSSNAFFPNTTLPGTWIDFPVMLSTDAQFPRCAGSSINRPCISLDGRWFGESDSREIPGIFGGGSFKWFESMAGGRAQFIQQPLLTGGSWAWDYYRPDWVVAVSNPSGTTQQFDVLDMDSGQADTPVASFSDTSNVSLFSQATGMSLFPVQEQNLATGCSNVTDCSAGGGGPEIFTYDLSGCEAALAANCATRKGQMNVNLLIGTGYQTDGTPHAIAQEYHLHDPYFRRGTTNFVLNYGTASQAGEEIFYQVPYAATSGSQATPLFPVQAPTVNLNYLSHPAVTSGGGVIVGGGPPYCAYIQESSPGLNQCTQNGAFGTVYWDLLRQGTCSTSVSFTEGAIPDPTCGLVQFDTTAVGHTAADGFNPSFIGHDNGGADVYDGSLWELFWEAQWSPNQVKETVVYPWGNRPEDTNGQQANTFFFGPTQSADATKYGEAMLDSMTVGNYLLPWVLQVRAPQPPVLLSLASTGAAEVQWFAAPLNHEAQKYWVWKQPSCSGAWTRLASVSAVYLQTAPYSYTDAGLASGESACYGVTTQEWSGEESATMSQQVQISNAAGVFSQVATVPQGEVNFDSDPSPVTALSASEALVCATGCFAADTPAAPAVSAGTGGSLSAGSYSTEITYCKFVDFPANTVCHETKPSAAVITTVGAAGTLVVDTNNPSTMVGQDGYCVYDSYNSGPYYRDGCYKIPDYANGGSPENNGSEMVITIASHGSSGAPPASNTAVGGIKASWTNSASPATRFHLVLYGDGAVPSCSNPWAYEVGAPAASATSFYYAFPDQVGIANGVQQYLAIVDVDASGLLSTGTAYNVSTGVTVACN